MPYTSHDAMRCNAMCDGVVAGCGRAQLVKSRSIRRENQATVDKLVGPVIMHRNNIIKLKSNDFAPMHAEKRPSGGG